MRENVSRVFCIFVYGLCIFIHADSGSSKVLCVRENSCERFCIFMCAGSDLKYASPVCMKSVHACMYIFARAQF